MTFLAAISRFEFFEKKQVIPSVSESDSVAPWPNPIVEKPSIGKPRRWEGQGRSGGAPGQPRTRLDYSLDGKGG